MGPGKTSSRMLLHEHHLWELVRFVCVCVFVFPLPVTVEKSHSSQFRLFRV